jgi:hypothetical protein
LNSNICGTCTPGNIVFVVLISSIRWNVEKKQWKQCFATQSGCIIIIIIIIIISNYNDANRLPGRLQGRWAVVEVSNLLSVASSLLALISHSKTSIPLIAPACDATLQIIKRSGH